MCLRRITKLTRGVRSTSLGLAAHCAKGRATSGKHDVMCNASADVTWPSGMRAKKRHEKLFIMQSSFFIYIFMKTENCHHLAVLLTKIRLIVNRSMFYWLSKVHFKTREFRLSIPLKDCLRTAHNSG